MQLGGSLIRSQGSLLIKLLLSMYEYELYVKCCVQVC